MHRGVNLTPTPPQKEPLKSPPELGLKCKILDKKLNCQEQSFADVLQNRYSWVLTNFAGKHLSWSLFLIKLHVFRARNFIIKRLQLRRFPVNFPKFLRTPFLQNTSGWIFLSNLAKIMLLASYWKYYYGWSLFIL